MCCGKCTSPCKASRNGCAIHARHCAVRWRCAAGRAVGGCAGKWWARDDAGCTRAPSCGYSSTLLRVLEHPPYGVLEYPHAYRAAHGAQALPEGREALAAGRCANVIYNITLGKRWRRAGARSARGGRPRAQGGAAPAGTAAQRSPSVENADCARVGTRSGNASDESIGTLCSK